MIKKHHQNTSGFTLIEMCIVVIISGLLMVAAIEAYRVYDAKRKIDQINTQMVNLDQYIKNFPAMIDPSTIDPATGIGSPYGRFPCPAPMDGAAAGNDFNREDCSTPSVAGVRPNGGNGGAPVLIGKIPAATLGLSSDAMLDPYGNYLVYAVTQAASDSGTYGTTSGSIQVVEEGVDRNPASPTYGQVVELERHNTVQYMVVSMGDSDAGAYAFNGAQLIGCPDDTVKEHENCDGDARFISSLLHEANATNFYDDKLFFAVNTVVVPRNEEPAACGQIKLFNAASGECPEGWVRNETLEKQNVSVVGPSFTHSVPFLNEGSPTSASGPIHYNIDPETGDYYFTSFSTPDTVKTFDPTSGNTSGFGGPSIFTQKVCEIADSNKSKSKCSEKPVQVTVPVSKYGLPTGALSDQIIDKYARDIREKCPEGYKPLEITGQHLSYYMGRGNQYQRTNIIVTCSK